MSFGLSRYSHDSSQVNPHKFSLLSNPVKMGPYITEPSSETFTFLAPMALLSLELLKRKYLARDLYHTMCTGMVYSVLCCALCLGLAGTKSADQSYYHPLRNLPNGALRFLWKLDLPRG